MDQGSRDNAVTLVYTVRCEEPWAPALPDPEILQPTTLIGSRRVVSQPQKVHSSSHEFNILSGCQCPEFRSFSESSRLILLLPVGSMVGYWGCEP